MSSRLFDVRLHNETSIVLHRHSHSVKHGTWRSWLPERIPASSDVGFSCSFTRTFNGVCFCLNYGAVLNRVRYLLQIQLERNGSDESISAVFVPEAQVESAINGRAISIDNTCPVIFKVHHERIDCEKTDRSKKSFRVRVQETADGNLYIKGLKECMEQLIAGNPSASSRYAPAGGLEAYRIYESLPDDFTWSTSTSTWISRLRKSTRSVLIRIVNYTGKQLKLIHGHGATFIDEGQWAEYPSEDIPHLCGTEFGIRSTSYFGGTGGQCVYSVLGESGTLTFSWDQPSMGSIHAYGTHSKGEYSIAKHIESMNEATILFHIYGMTSPFIDLWAAKAISPGASEKALDLTTLERDANGDHVFERITTSVALNSNHIGTGAYGVVNVLPLLLKYCEVVSDRESSSRNDSPAASEPDEYHYQGGTIGEELHLKNPRTFFNACIIGKRRDYDGKVSENHLLYLEWGIGNARFSKIFMPDERILIRGNIPGGIENKKILFYSYLMIFRFDRPEVTCSLIDTSCAIQSSRESRTRPFLKTLTQSDLLEYVMMIFHALCEGLQPFVVKPMVKKYGNGWVDKVKIPVGNVWKSEDHVRIDVEGMVYLITAYWIELFEELMEGDSTTLHTIQTAAIYWANQELYRFDSAYVWDMLEATKQLLHRIKAENAIKHIEFISHKLLVP